MKTKDIMNKLNDEMKKVEVPNVLPTVLSASPSQFKEPLPKSKQTNKLFRFLASGVALILIVAFVFSLPTLTFDSTVYASITMDINPSIEISINEQSQVVSIEAYNNDGTELLRTINFKRKKLDEIIERLVVRATNLNYLLTSQNFLYLTINCEDVEVKQSLETKLKTRIISACQDEGIQTQEDEIGFGNYEENESEKEQAEIHGISCSKLNYIKEVYENTNNSYDTLESFLSFMQDKPMRYIRDFYETNIKQGLPQGQQNHTAGQTQNSPRG